MTNMVRWHASQDSLALLCLRLIFDAHLVVIDRLGDFPLLLKLFCSGQVLPEDADDQVEALKVLFAIQSILFALRIPHLVKQAVSLQHIQILVVQRA